MLQAVNFTRTEFSRGTVGPPPLLMTSVHCAPALQECRMASSPNELTHQSDTMSSAVKSEGEPWETYRVRFRSFVLSASRRS
jgi:hypothetical protein